MQEAQPEFIHKYDAPYVSYSCLLYLALVPYTVAGEAQPSSPAKVVTGLLQHLYRFLSDEELCTAQAVCVAQALEYRRPDREVIIGPPPERGKDGEAGRAPCGALEEAVLHAAKLYATRDLRPKHRLNYTQVVGAEAGQRWQSEALAGKLSQGLRPSCGSATQLLWAGLTAEQVSWILLQVWLGPVSGRPSQQQAPQQQGPQGQRGPEGAFRLLVAGDPSLQTLLILLLQVTKTVAAGRGLVFQPSADAHLANVLLHCDTPVTEEVRRTAWVMHCTGSKPPSYWQEPGALCTAHVVRTVHMPYGAGQLLEGFPPYAPSPKGELKRILADATHKRD